MSFDLLEAITRAQSRHNKVLRRRRRNKPKSMKRRLAARRAARKGRSKRKAATRKAMRTKRRLGEEVMSLLGTTTPEMTAYLETLGSCSEPCSTVEECSGVKKKCSKCPMKAVAESSEEEDGPGRLAKLQTYLGTKVGGKGLRKHIEKYAKETGEQTWKPALLKTALAGGVSGLALTRAYDYLTAGKKAKEKEARELAHRERVLQLTNPLLAAQDRNVHLSAVPGYIPSPHQQWASHEQESNLAESKAGKLLRQVLARMGRIGLDLSGRKISHDAGTQALLAQDPSTPSF